MPQEIKLSDITQLGFVGLGAMGAGIARLLMGAGHPLVGWNRTRAKAEHLVDAGMGWADTPREAAAGADVLFTMLVDDAATRAVLVDGGVLDAMAPGSIHVNMATVSVAFAREMAALHVAKGIGYVAAPVLGRVDVAQAGKLNILAGGSAGRPGRPARHRVVAVVGGQSSGT